MTQKNKECMQRAIGIIEGLAWVADGKVSDALVSVCEVLDAIVIDEEKHEKEKA